MSDPFLERVHAAFRGVQNEQVAALAAFDGALQQTRDTWDRPEGGGGDTRILQQGRVVEKGAEFQRSGRAGWAGPSAAAQDRGGPVRGHRGEQCCTPTTRTCPSST